MLIMRRHMRFSSYHSRGLAISVILLAVVLLAAIAVAIAIGSRNSINNAGTQQAKTYAGVILKQASTWHDGHTLKQYADGKTGWLISQSDLTDVNTGWIEPQQPPTDAFTSTPSAQWIYKAESNGQPTVQLANTGYNGWVQTVVLVNLKQHVCEQINKLLQGATTIPVETVGTSTDWSTPSTIMNLTGETATSGKPSQCVQAADGPYVFYATMQTW